MEEYKLISYFLLTLGIGVSAVSASRITHFCGSTRYYLDEQICCNSKLSNLIQDGQTVDCCTSPLSGGKIYKPGSHICCGDVYNRTYFEEQNFSCCNGKPIMKIGEICCGGEIISSSGRRGCCGNKSFELRLGICCRDKLHHKKNFHGRCCGSETYDDQTHYCQVTNSFEGILPINSERCGKYVINQLTHTCCYEDTPVDITKYRGQYPPVCCNKTIIPDKNNFHCVSDRILPINQSLCKKKTENGETQSVYNFNDQLCCNGNVVQKNSTSGRIEVCCGSEVIDSTTHSCCAGKQPYSNFKHCCGDTVVNRKEACCGAAILTAEQVCCNESNNIFPVQKQTKFDDHCCNGKPYRRGAGPCLRNVLTSTCGRQPFNSSADRCCSNNLHKGANRPDIKCCGAYIQNITYQDCIMGRPKNRTTNTPFRNNHVCGQRNIRVRKRKDRCCLNKFHKNAKLDGLRCCGAEVYDERTHKCCFGKPVLLNSISCKTRNRRHNSKRLRNRQHKSKRLRNRRHNSKRPRNQRHKSKRPRSLMCSSSEWNRMNILQKHQECIQQAYVLQKQTNGYTYRKKHDLAPKKRGGRSRTWDVRPSCKHVLGHRRFIFISFPSGNYTLKYSKKYLPKVKELINKKELCSGLD